MFLDSFFLPVFSLSLSLSSFVLCIALLFSSRCMLMICQHVYDYIYGTKNEGGGLSRRDALMLSCARGNSLFWRPAALVMKQLVHGRSTQPRRLLRLCLSYFMAVCTPSILLLLLCNPLFSFSVFLPQIQNKKRIRTGLIRVSCFCSSPPSRASSAA